MSRSSATLSTAVKIASNSNDYSAPIERIESDPCEASSSDTDRGTGKKFPEVPVWERSTPARQLGTSPREKFSAGPGVRANA